MAKRLTLPSAPEVEVVLSDPDAGLERVYRVVLLSRGVKNTLAELGEQVQEEADLDKPDEAKVLRLMCDQLNVVLETKAEGAPSAGDLLFAGWEAEKVSDDQILELYTGIMESASDPT